MRVFAGVGMLTRAVSYFACRYLEAIDSIFEDLTFHFHFVDNHIPQLDHAAHNFLVINPHPSLDRLRSISFSFATWGGPQGEDAAFHPRDLRQVVADELDDQVELCVWRAIERLPGLRRVVVQDVPHLPSSPRNSVSRLCGEIAKRMGQGLAKKVSLEIGDMRFGVCGACGLGVRDMPIPRGDIERKEKEGIVVAECSVEGGAGATRFGSVEWLEMRRFVVVDDEWPRSEKYVIRRPSGRCWTCL